MWIKIQSVFILCVIFNHQIVADLFYYAPRIEVAESRFDQNLSHYEFSNCSQYSIAYGSTCKCFNCEGAERCRICCDSPGFTCCYCDKCSTTCWNNEWRLVSFAQVGFSTALLVAIVVTIALFLRLCSSSSGLRFWRSRNSSDPLIRDSISRMSVSSIQQYIIDRLQDRPPRYGDLSDAPPEYDTDPRSNRMATTEAPPKYTRRPGLAERTQLPTLPSEIPTQLDTTVTLPSAPPYHHM